MHEASFKTSLTDAEILSYAVNFRGKVVSPNTIPTEILETPLFLI